MLEKEVGHPVSPKDNRDDTSLNPNPKEADDIRSEYITLFSLPASPYQPPMGAPRCQESLLGGGAQQAIPSHLPSLRKAGENGRLSGDAEEIEIFRLKFVIRERKMLSTHWTMILIGCAGGLIPDALRIIKNRHDPKVLEYLRSVTFWMGLLLLVIFGRTCSAAGRSGQRETSPCLRLCRSRVHIEDPIWG